MSASIPTPTLVTSGYRKMEKTILSNLVRNQCPVYVLLCFMQIYARYLTRGLQKQRENKKIKSTKIKYLVPPGLEPGTFRV